MEKTQYGEDTNVWKATDMPINVCDIAQSQSGHAAYRGHSLSMGDTFHDALPLQRLYQYLHAYTYL